MLNDATGLDKIFIATGYTDLRRGIDGLASTIKYQFELDPFQEKHPVSFLWQTYRQNQRLGLWRWLCFTNDKCWRIQLATHKREAMEVLPNNITC